MKPSPCLHPIQVYNESLGYKVAVPCGHCEACVCAKGYERTARIEDSFLRFRYRYFATLTYNDENLPIARYDDSVCAYVHPNDCDYNGEVYHVDVYDKDGNYTRPLASSLDFVNSCERKFGGIPVLSHSDIINFKKRLRYYLSQKLKLYEKIFIYCCGEYGPTGFRPHYHLLLGTNSESVSRYLRECVYQAWTVNHKGRSSSVLISKGKIDFQRCYDRGGTNYCAAYVSCVTNLPYVLAYTDFRPFGRGSRPVTCPDVSCVGSWIRNEKTVVSVKTGENYVAPLSERDKNTVYPRFSGFNKLSPDDRIYVYTLYRRFPYRTSEEFAKGFLANLEPWHVHAMCNDHFVRDVEFQLIRRDDEMIVSQLTNNVHDNLKRLWLVSRRFCRNADSLGLTDQAYLDMINIFYSNVELTKLRKFYELLNDLMDDPYHPLPLCQAFSLYYNTEWENLRCRDRYLKQFQDPYGHSLDSISQQAEYAAKCKKILGDTTKTKKRNDHFVQNGKRPKRYIPIFTNSSLKILNKF